MRRIPKHLIWAIIGEVLAAIVYVMISYSDPRDERIRTVSAGVTMGYIFVTGTCLVLLAFFLVKRREASADEPKSLVDGRMLLSMALVTVALIAAEALSLTRQGAKSIEFMILTTIVKLAMEGPYLMLGGVAGLWCNRMLARTS